MPRSVSLLWSGIFCRKPSIAEPGSEEDDDRSRSSTALDRTPVRAGVDQSLVILPSADGGERRDAAVDASHRRAVPGDALVRLAADGAASAPQRLVCWAPSCPSADAQDGLSADLPAPEDQRAASAAPDVAISASPSGRRPAEPGLVRDVTYIPMRRGFLYLVAIMDWFSRKVLAWRLSNTMDADFCVTALEEAIARFGKPEIFNTDQGSQFTCFAFTNTLKDADIRISMDGRGRWMDNVFIERLWRSLKYECVYLNAFETGSEARAGIGRWIDYYNADRPHSVFAGRTPDEVYATQANEEKLAA